MGLPESGARAGGIGAASILLPLLFAGTAALAGSTSECYLRGDRLVSPCWEIRGDVFFYTLLAWAEGLTAFWLVLRLLRIRISYLATWTDLSPIAWLASGTLLVTWAFHVLRFPWFLGSLVWLATIFACVTIVFRAASPFASRKKAGIAAGILVAVAMAAVEAMNGSFNSRMHFETQKDPATWLGKMARFEAKLTSWLGAREPRALKGFLYWISQRGEFSAPISPKFSIDKYDTDSPYGFASPIYPTEIRLDEPGPSSGYRVVSARFTLDGEPQSNLIRGEVYGSETLSFLKLRFDESRPKPVEKLEITELTAQDASGQVLRFPVRLHTNVVYHQAITPNNAMHAILKGFERSADISKSQSKMENDRQIELGNQFSEFLAGGREAPDLRDLEDFAQRYSEVTLVIEEGIWRPETTSEPDGRADFSNMSLWFVLTPARAMLSRGYLEFRDGKREAGMRAVLDVYRLARVLGSANGTEWQYLMGYVLTGMANEGAKFFLGQSNSVQQSASTFERLLTIDGLKPYYQSWTQCEEADLTSWRPMALGYAREARWRDPFFPISEALRTEPVSRSQALPNYDVATRVGYELVKAFLAVAHFKQVDGRWPKDLDQATTKVGLTLPQDLYAGAPVRYESHRNQFSVYSFGPDGDDDHGTKTCEKWEAPTKETTCDGDWVLSYSEPSTGRRSTPPR